MTRQCRQPRPLAAVCGASIAGLLLGLSFTPAAATVGLAEWTVLTPGGHLICHADGWKERHGDCLRDAENDTVYVSDLLRWRYYPGHVIGQTEAGYFVFDEVAETVHNVAGERELARLARDLGQPSSPWLTGRDGWLEAWFPFLVWSPCRRGEAPLADVPCAMADDPAVLERYRRTTWGVHCRQMRLRGRTDPGLDEFCTALREPTVP